MMKTTGWISIKGLSIVGTGVVLAGAGVWGWSVHQRRLAGTSTLPREYSVQSIKARMLEPGGTGRRAWEMMRRDEISDEQRAELWRNMRRAFDELLTKRVDEYFNASPDEQAAVLDRHIDDFRSRMAAWRRRSNDQDRMGDRDRGGPPFRRAFAQRSQEERKAMSESRNPDQTGRRLAYFSAVQQRMAQRGISAPFGPGGRGGGPGGRALGGRP